MTEQAKQQITDSIREFRPPAYTEIPNVGLYLEQTVKFINESMGPLLDGAVTASMVSNYVKKGLVASPVKKQYGRDQIAYLMFIALAKNVLSMENIGLLFDMQKKTYTCPVAYDYFCRELCNVVEYVFGLKPAMDTVGRDSTDEKMALRSVIVAATYKIYLGRCFEAIRQESADC
ncbi:MAG: DUF1836 domain-containing protein [Gemmiger sp.]